jgi:hypothetical protein
VKLFDRYFRLFKDKKGSHYIRGFFCEPNGFAHLYLANQEQQNVKIINRTKNNKMLRKKLVQ